MKARRPLQSTFLLLAFPLAACRVSYTPPAPSADARPMAAQAADTAALVPNAQEARLAELLTTSPEQRRATLRHSPVLARVARARAEDMARHGYFSHVTREGWGANRLVEQAGYRLPESYDQSRGGNSIESLGRGYATAEAAWRRWMGSQAHRAHLLGLNPVFAEQTEYGIGFAGVRGVMGSQYWVVLIARPGP
jgi:uncharacterized protein YkwD